MRRRIGLGSLLLAAVPGIVALALSLSGCTGAAAERACSAYDVVHRGACELCAATTACPWRKDPADGEATRGAEQEGPEGEGEAAAPDEGRPVQEEVGP